LPAVLSFSQVYLSSDQRGVGVEQAAIDLLARLRSEDPDSGAIASWGDSIMLETSYAGQTEREVSAAFGEIFAEAVSKPSSNWLWLHDRWREP
jgi:hypothetical protein